MAISDGIWTITIQRCWQKFLTSSLQQTSLVNSFYYYTVPIKCTYKIISDYRHVSVLRHAVKRTAKSIYNKKHIKSYNCIRELFEVATFIGGVTGKE